MDFRFQHPWFLLLLLVLPVLAWLLGRMGRAAALRFSSVALARQVRQGRRSAAGRLLFSLQFLGLAGMIVALARPQKVEIISADPQPGVDIVLGVDVSGSMLGLDFQIDNHPDTRLEAAKIVISDFISKRENDRIGIVAFAGAAYLVSPLTLNQEWLRRNVERLNTGLINEQGTAIGDSIGMATNRLKDLDAPTKVIILLTDGSNNAGRLSPVAAAEAAAAFGVKIYTIAIGTNDVVPYPRVDQNMQVVRDARGRPIVRGMNRYPVDEESLRQVAQIASGRFYRATDTEQLQEIYSEIDELETSEVDLEIYAEYHERFFWPLALGLGLIGLQQALAHTRFRRLP